MRTFCIFLLMALPGLSADIWLDVPLVRQHKDGCGAAAAAMVLQYWAGQGAKLGSDDTGNDRIYQALYSRADHGIRADSLESYLKRSGFYVFAMAGTRADLADHIGKGRPLIVCLREGHQLHYEVVRGIGRLGVWLNDPADGRAHLAAWSEFDTHWKEAANWLLLAVPRQQPTH